MIPYTKLGDFKKRYMKRKTLLIDRCLLASAYKFHMDMKVTIVRVKMGMHFEMTYDHL